MRHLRTIRLEKDLERTLVKLLSPKVVQWNIGYKCLLHRPEAMMDQLSIKRSLLVNRSSPILLRNNVSESAVKLTITIT
ncbi:hypothetical protein TNCV_2762141 [Trichonephila clavipes]|nr:hypothetical protein TNCV_2762141 [Trichonephila clavipes]